MTKQMNNFQTVLQFAASPKFILFCLALYNLLAVSGRNANLCFYNWSDQFLMAFLILLATCLLRVGKLWGNFAAVLTCFVAMYDFCHTALLYAGVLSPSSPNTDASELKFADWLRVMSYNPAEYLQAILAATVLVFALYYLLKNARQKKLGFK